MTRRERAERREELFETAAAMIAERFADRDLNLPEVAAAVGTSPRQLQRIFREFAGTGFQQALTTVRMERALVLLDADDQPAARQVAPLVGYNHAGNFATAFRRYWGGWPSDVRRSPTYRRSELHHEARLDSRPVPLMSSALPRSVGRSRDQRARAVTVTARSTRRSAR